MAMSPIPPIEKHVLTPSRDVINSLWRGLQILELLAVEPEGLLAKTISFRSRLNLSTCYHLLNTLIAAGYVAKSSGTQRFVLADKICFPSQSLLSGAPLIPYLEPHLRSLRDETRESAYLSLRQNHQIILSAIVTSPQALRVAMLYVGYDGANHAMALGKAILAHCEERDVLDYLKSMGMPRFTTQTLTEPAALLAELVEVRERGYGLDLGEVAEDVCCIAAPIFNANNRVVAALGIALPASRYARSGVRLAQQVVATATAATRTLALLRYTMLEPAE
jgi:DNA-binding IclR family transcriptional regulator